MNIKINIEKIIIILFIIIIIYYIINYNNENFDNSSELIILNKINNVCIVSFCKDEYDLIDDFINYHAYLFGIHNIYIIDNNSTHPHVLNVYEKFKEKGGNLSYYDDFYKQGEETTRIFHSIKHKYDYLISLDIDEFLYLKTSTDLSNIDELKNYFDNLPKNVEKFIISYNYAVVDPKNENYIDNKISYPARYMNYFKPDNYPIKIFYRSNTFIDTAIGNHTGNSTNNIDLFSDIKFYHYHYAGGKRLYERGYNICKGYNYINENNSIRDKILQLQNIYNSYPFGIHRVFDVLLFLIKEYVIIQYIKYFNKLPTLEELNSYNNILINLDDIDNQFKNVNVINENININYNNLLYYDKEIDNNDNSIEYDDRLIKCLEKINNVI